MLKQSKNRNKVFSIEILIVIGVVTVLFTIMLPKFFNNQNATKLDKAQEVVNQIAEAYAKTEATDHVGPIASQYIFDAWAKSRERFFSKSDSTFSLSLYHDRIWLDKNRLPIAGINKNPLFQNSEIEIWIDIFTFTEDISFVVYAWMGADKNFLNTTFKNDDLYFAPVLDTSGYYKMEPRYPLYGPENGWGNPGVVYCDSYQAGWRRRHTIFENEQ